MIDSLEMLRGKIENQKVYHDFGLKPGGYGIVTLHRPSNVDNPVVLKRLSGILEEIAEQTALVFPVHPRTRKKMEENHLLSAMKKSGKIFLPEPMNYIRFMNLVFHCALVITDSGGIQEETSYLGIPCLTIRENTERPITITHGTNRLCGLDEMKRKTVDLLRDKVRKKKEIELWDGHTAERIVGALERLHNLLDIPSLRKSIG